MSGMQIIARVLFVWWRRLNLVYAACGHNPPKLPAELSDYTDLAAAVGMTPDDYVRAEEGTFNNANGHFACDTCYIRMGMPVGRNGRRWVAP
jgi:hypothetical protein